jgi:hypothetical protein
MQVAEKCKWQLWVIAEVIRSRGVEKTKIVPRIKNGSTEPYSLLQHVGAPSRW